MNELPLHTPIVFIVTVVSAFLFVFKASHSSAHAAKLMLAWILAQSFLALSGFYFSTEAIPPRFVWLVAPPIALLLVLLLTKTGKLFLNSLDLKWLTLLHVIRLPVEIVLYELFIAHQIPELMTFEGRNPDILSGLTAVPIFLIAFRKNGIRKKLLIVWNVLALLLVLNVMVNGMLSAPSQIQQFAFEQPNRAVLHFPFNLLPSFIVPLVVLAHLASLRILFAMRKIRIRRSQHLINPIL